MSKKLCFLISFILAINPASISYSAPSMIKLDFDERGDVNTEPGFSSYLLSENGKEVNGISIDLAGNIDDKRRSDPNSVGSGIPIYTEQVYRDFICGINPSGVTITLWGLGDNQECDITIYSFDNNSEPNRLADWYGNGEYLFTTNFEGGDVYQWPSPWWGVDYAFGPATATADEFGRIILTSIKNPASPTGMNFAFANGLAATPKGTYVSPVYAQHPMPFDDEEDVSTDTILSWKKSEYANKHDVYFGTDETKVTDANRSNPMGVLVSENHSTTTYDPPGLLRLGTIYYWRIDEVNGAPDYTIFKGEVWNFRIIPYSGVVENFDSYANTTALRSVWKDGSTNGTSAEISVESTIVRSGKSMRYQYNNTISPYYSQTYVDTADLGMDDPDWFGLGVKTLVLYFYGDPNNPLTEQMYIKLTDGDSPPKSATVTHDNMNDVRLKQWNKWGIALTEFADVNLANVVRVTIGFGDGSGSGEGTVYFEDMTLDSEEAEVLPEVTGEVDVSTTYQELEGFGAATGWEENFILGVSQPARNTLYDILFDESGLDIYRLRNTYNQGSSGTTYMNNAAQIVAAGKARNPSLKIMISGWSPPVSLKSNNNLAGGTLKKDAYGNYMYDAFAQWWADSLTSWSSKGVIADYVSMQNEPDYLADWDSCVFDPTQNSSYAGYRQAFEAVYQKLFLQMGQNMPKLVAPETAGINFVDTYINNLVDANHAYGYAHHLYNGGGSYDNADGYIWAMTNFRNNYGNKPLMQTEFSKGGAGDVTTFAEAMNLARLMHNSLVFEDASAYIYWELVWEHPKGLVSFPSWGEYRINPIYYAFKQYAAFTDPGWHRIEASTSLGSTGNLRISAFKSPDNQELSIVIINISDSNINLTLNLNCILPESPDIYRTSATENSTYIGLYDKNNSLMLPGQSITTINGPVLSTCEDILNAGYDLTSDIDSDCHVNYKDFAIIANYWLNTDCDLYDNCEGADFEPRDGDVDFSDLNTFVLQWMLCNEPNDPGCVF